jgi:PQQ-dependent dehydrogenase (s-GDH family)
MSMNYSAVAAILPISVMLTGLVWAQDGPESVVRGTKQFRKSVLVSGLAGPWELTWGPDDKLWVTERTGKRVTRIDPTTGERSVAIAIDEVSAPGSQDGLLGMALHPDLLKGSGDDYVYVAYTYVDRARGAVPAVTDPRSPYRYFYSKIVRLTYDKAKGTLSQPVELIAGLPAGNDHVSGRLKIGPDRKLYFTVGDGGHGQQGNFCLPIEAQRLPTQEEVDRKSYLAYVGKSLRLNLDGSIPKDNPKLAGVVSHVYTYGHRNMQGIDFAPDGTLYASEQGPKTDDEINILKAGGNYGWPHVAGMRDDKAYEYARWADASTPCTQLRFSDLNIDPSVPRESESSYKEPIVEPIATMFTVPAGYNFHDPACRGVDFICWPTVAASSIEYYGAKSGGILGWDRVLLVTALKRGSLYVAHLAPGGQAVDGHFARYFQSENRYRDTAVSPDGKTIYIATDPGGQSDALAGGVARTMQNPGAILSFTYEGEGFAPTAGEPRTASPAIRSAAGTELRTPAVAAGPAPQFRAAQAAAGKTAYNSNCAVCHGGSMTDGTFGPPLAGDYFKDTWSGRTVRAFYDRAKAMPPASPGSLPEDVYVNILAYVLQVNGFQAGNAELNSGSMLDRAIVVK